MKHIISIAIGSIIVIPITSIVIFWVWLLTVNPSLFLFAPITLSFLYLCWTLGDEITRDKS